MRGFIDDCVSIGLRLGDDELNRFPNVVAVLTADELLGMLAASPLDRMLVYGSDLSDDEWDNGLSMRSNDSVLLVVEGEGEPNGRVVGIVGSEQERDLYGRRKPEDIYALMRQAEDGSGPLAWVYDGAFALPQHPRAEIRIP